MFIVHVYSHALCFLSRSRHAMLSGVPQQLQPRSWSSVQCLGTQGLCPDWGTWLLLSCIFNMCPRDWHTGKHTHKAAHTYSSHRHPTLMGPPNTGVDTLLSWYLIPDKSTCSWQVTQLDKLKKTQNSIWQRYKYPQQMIPGTWDLWSCSSCWCWAPHLPDSSTTPRICLWAHSLLPPQWLEVRDPHWLQQLLL